MGASANANTENYGSWNSIPNAPKKPLHPVTTIALSGVDTHLAKRLNPDLAARIMKTLSKPTKRFRHGSNTPVLNVLRRSHHLGEIGIGSRAMTSKRHARLLREQRAIEERERQLLELERFKQAAIDNAVAQVAAVRREEDILERDRERLMNNVRGSNAVKTLRALSKKRRQRSLARTQKAIKQLAKTARL
jgi:hypothetical protein